MSSIDKDEIEYMSKVPYASIVDSIMYAMICTRLDITYTISDVSRFITNLEKNKLASCEVDSSLSQR